MSTSSDSTSTTAPNIASLSSSSASPSFSGSLYQALKPAVEAIDANVKSVYDSQYILTQKVETLSKILEQFSDTQELPMLNPYTEKLVYSRKKLFSLSDDINRISARIENIRAMVHANQSKHQPQPPPPPPTPTSTTAAKPAPSLTTSTSTSTPSATPTASPAPTAIPAPAPVATPDAGAK